MRPVSLVRLVSIVFCGLVVAAFISDNGSHPPPATGTYAYNSFVPSLPPNSSYVDPVFGETVNRLTADGSHDDIYARNMWWNADGTLYLHRSQSGGKDRWQVINAATGTVEYDNIPFGSSAADGGFDPVNPNVLYYYSGSNIERVTLEGSGTWATDTYFTAPATIESLGGTLNWFDANGQYLVVRYGPEPSVHVYKTSALSSPYANPIDASDNIDHGGYVGITPDGEYLVGWDETGGGVNNSGLGQSWKLDSVNNSIAASPTSFWSLCGDHGDFLSATDGHDYMITYDCHTQPGLWRVDITNDAVGLNESQQQALPNNNKLVDFSPNWNNFGHISATARADWAYFDSEDSSDTFNSGTNDGNGFITPWHAFRQEVAAVDVVPTTPVIRRLAHHRSRWQTPRDYYSEPRVSASWGGNYLGFASNFNQLNGSGAPITDIYDIPFAAYSSGAQPVRWADPQNVTVTGSSLNSLQKTSGCDGCADAGAIALQHISATNGYVEFTATETAALRWVGLTQALGGYAASPDFALRLQSADAEVREAGVYKADTTFVSGDVFRITVQSGTITYSKNGTAFYSHAVTIPDSQLVVVAILHSLNSTVTNAMVSGAS